VSDAVSVSGDDTGGGRLTATVRLRKSLTTFSDLAEWKSDAASAILAAAMKAPMLQETITDSSGAVFEIYAYRPLTRVEILREIAFLKSERCGQLWPEHTYRILSNVGNDAA
jgi:hypothetical protein